MRVGDEASPAEPSLLLIHLRWAVAEADVAPLNDEMLTRLRAYLPRYAETLSTRCLAVGGVGDHLHLLLDLPTTKSLEEVTVEMRRASQRFVREVLGSTLFLWANSEQAYRSVSPTEQGAVIAYILAQREHHASGDLWDAFEAAPSLPLTLAGDTVTMPNPDETLPSWLRVAMTGAAPNDSKSSPRQEKRR